MVGGAILVAVSVELRLTHDHLTTAMVLVTIAGPVLYLLGNVLFLRSRFGQVARTRWVAMAVIGGLAVRTMLGRKGVQQAMGDRA